MAGLMARARRALRGAGLACVAAASLLLPGRAAHAQSTPWPGPTVEAIRQRGQLSCGVDVGIPGFAFQDGSGAWKGFDVGYCRAIAAAVLGDPDKVRYVGTTAAARFTVLQSGEIDVLIRDSTLTFTRSVQLGLDEVVVNFYAGQGFLVRKSLGATSAADLNGATICVVTGGSLELNIADFARSHGTKIGTVLFDKAEEAMEAAEAGRCDGYTDDTGSLAAVRSTTRNPDDWVVLDGVISEEPLGIHARSGDPHWQKILFWIHEALLTAEASNVTRANIDDMKANSRDPFVRRLLGQEDDFGKLMGLDNQWAYRAIRDVGNYGELYDAYFGPKALRLPRGLNNLWNKGGLHCPLPFR